MHSGGLKGDRKRARQSPETIDEFIGPRRGNMVMIAANGIIMSSVGIQVCWFFS
jgi:hypothetical protein